MGLQDMVRWILPREEMFFSLIERQTEVLEKAAKALATFGDGVPAEQVYQAVKAHEDEADKLIFEIEERFAQVFVTPIDREDIQLLAAGVEDIVDILNLTARTFVLLGVPKPTKPMADLMAVIVKLAELLRQEMPALSRHQYAKLIPLARTIKTLEKEGDAIFRQAVSDLFHDDTIVAQVLLRDKEVLEDLENAVDKFESVAERIKHLAVKHG